MTGMRRCSVAEASVGRSSLERTGPGAWHRGGAAKDTSQMTGMRRCSLAEASVGRSSLERTRLGAWHRDGAAKDVS